METSTLRWIIIIIGVLVLGAIFLFGHPKKKRKPRASRRQEMLKTQRREPTLNSLYKSDEFEAADGKFEATQSGGGTKNGPLFAVCALSWNIWVPLNPQLSP